MMKKVLAFVLILALALGALAVTATASETNEIDYRVGYAKVDLNPYWSVWKAAGNEIPSQAETSTGSAVTEDHVMPLPMGGYGGNVHRLSRPELVDDTGTGSHASGVVYLSSNRYTQDFAKEMLGDGTDAYNAYAAKGFGQNDGDGIYGTCVAIQEHEGAEPVLYFSVDFIGMSDTYCGQAKLIIINELKNMGLSISPDRILINATHTHGSVALGESFADSTTYYQKLYGNKKEVGFSGNLLGNILSTYRRHIYTQLAAAAVKALTEGQTNGSVTMSKGTIDVSDATGYQLNGVRHIKAEKEVTLDGETKTVQYVTGSSFNVFSGDNEFDAVSDSDDKMHVLQFAFPDNSNVEPILMINWRAHTTANNKMGKVAHNNLSADFVASMRWKLEQWGYRPLLIYGASGNLGMGDTPITYNATFDYDATTYMAGRDYGYILAYAAITQARGAATSSSHPAYSYRSTLLSTLYSLHGSTYRNTIRDFRPDAMVTCTQGPILLESIDYDVKNQTPSTDSDYQAALYHDALATDQGSKPSDDGGLKVKTYPLLVKAGTHTANGETFTTTKDIVFASQYHSNAVKNRHGAVNTKRISLCAFTLGDQVAFVTMPFEASDRYSMDAKLTTANDYNDWNNLINEQKWGTPFVASLMNGTEGYFPNYLAYTYQGVVNGQQYDLQKAYAEGRTTHRFVNGSYEAHIAYAKAGEGEAVVAQLNTLLRGLSDKQDTPATKTGYCEACKETVTWTQMLTSKQLEDYGNNLPSGHYYLTENYNSLFGSVTIYVDQNVCLDLNGYTFYADSNAGGRAFGIYSTLNVMDSVGGGILKSDGLNRNNGGVLYVGSGGVLNLYSGKVTSTNQFPTRDGGCIYVASGGIFNMYGGTVSGGQVTEYGGNVDVQDGTFNMYGGTITGGSYHPTLREVGSDGNSYQAGKNFLLSAGGTFRYVNGTIASGKTTTHLMGHVVLGDHDFVVTNPASSVLALKNYATVTLDGVFTGQVTLYYNGVKSDKAPYYPKEPAAGDTIGAVTSGSRIDHHNGAKIALSNTSAYEGIVSGTNLIVGEKPITTYCEACDAYMVWQPYNGETTGHYCLNSEITGAGTVTIPAGEKLCLDLNGNTYTATTRAFKVYGELNIKDSGTNGTLQSTAVANQEGGTIYVYAGGAVNQYGGTLTCDHSNNVKAKNGGVVYVLANGNYNLYNGTISGGQATTGGGNVYDCGRFTMYGGTITGGNAGSYGGNVHVQGSSAVFTIKGGTISNGTSATGPAICTGPNGSTSTSVLRIEGGKISGMIYVQGLAVLTGATDEAVNVKMRTKPDERLTIEGTYTGTLNLEINDVSSVATGTKIGISDGADISGATIQVTGAADGTYVAVVNNDLMLLEDVVTAIVVTTQPNKTYYDLGEELDTTGLVVTAYYASGKTEDVTADVAVSGYDPQMTGHQIVSVEYEGRHTTFEVHVRWLTGIRIDAAPFKRTYELGEELDEAGLVVIGIYSDNSEKVLTERCVVNGYDPQRAGSQTLQVDCEGMNATFDVFVRAMERIEIATMPNKTTYLLGETQDNTGLTLRAVYNNGDEELITEGFDVEAIDTSVAGMYPVRVTYREFEASFDVTVVEYAGNFKVGDVFYNDLAEALAASDSNNPLVLCMNLDALTLTQTTYIDLNGCNITNVTTGSYKLYVKDSQTSDFDVADGNYGKILSADKAANVAAMSYFLKVTENGAVSFHEYYVELTDLVINTIQRGITYKSTFNGDQLVKDQIKEFGIAMRAYSAPNTTSIWADPDCKTHVAMPQELWQVGNTTNSVKSVYVSNIIDPTLDAATNQARAQVGIFGRPYIQLNDGTMLFGEACGFSMQEAVEYVDSFWNDPVHPLSEEAKQDLVALYKTYSTLMESWNIPNAKAAAGKPE